jgi:sn-glycerol 3-phosphate transport system substrate-binding protein
MHQKIVIDVWLAEHPFPNYYGQPFLDPMRKMAAEFNAAHPDYRVDIRGIDYQALPQEVAQAVARGAGPDIAEYYASTEQLARDTYTPDGRPYFTSVERALAGRRQVLGEPVLIDDIEPLIRDFFSYAGELVSVPVTATTALLYSNTSLLAAAGVTEVPRTWDEVEAAGAAVLRLAGGPSHGVTWPNHGWLFQQAIAQQGGVLADNANGHTGRATTVDLAAKEMLAWADWWQRLTANGHFGHTDDWLTAFTAFASQQAAFTLSTSKLAHEYVQTGAEAGFGVTVSPMPYNSAVPHAGHTISGQSLWLADGLDQAKQDGALAFTQYLISPHNAAEWHKAVGFIPVTRAAYDLLDEAGWFAENPHQRAATDQIRAATRTPATAGALLGDFAGIQHAMTRAMDDVLRRGADPAARFGRATGEAQKLLDDHNACCLRPVPRTPGRLEVY